MFRNLANRNTNRGFTLIELLVVLVILSILMAIALPLYQSAISDAQRKTCRANMQTIANAVVAARVKSVAADYAASIAGNNVTVGKFPDLQSVPVCPTAAGPYTIIQGSGAANSSFKISCPNSSGGVAHSTFEPGVDSN